MVFPHRVLPCLILIRLRCHLAIYEKAYYKNGTARVLYPIILPAVARGKLVLTVPLFPTNNHKYKNLLALYK